MKILVEAKLDFQFDELFQGELRGFMLERVQHYFREVRGFKYDEVNAVLKVGVSTLKDVEDRLSHVARVRPTPNFEPLAASFKRINNILKQARFHATARSTRACWKTGPETELYEAYTKLPAQRSAGGRRGTKAARRPILRQGYGERAGSEDPREPIEHVERHAPQIFIDRRLLGDRNLRRPEIHE